MNVELNEEGYTLDGKWKLVPVEADSKMLDSGVAMALNVSVHGQGGWSKYISGLYCQLLNNSPKPELRGHGKGYSETWCKQCGASLFKKDHLISCPTLKSKL